ncbi:MAG: Snf7 family protein [Candidatus Bathyarchaeota archaeon]|nr:Snf7 family protein [Candidatus Termiticorpusculum sp.]MCL1970097.1 Snf7 family protein [Candidatus Termiticorpusculum sp.]
MSERFAKKWEYKRDETSLIDTVNQKVKPQEPLKRRLAMAARQLDVQVNRLEQTSERFTQKDNALFKKLVDAYQQHDMAHANMYATELAEIRKMSKLIMNARLALDQISLRIKTASELGDIVAMLGPCIGVLRSVNGGLGGILPAAENELGEIGDLLSGLMMEAGTGSGMSLNFDAVSEDAAKILSEASIVAEQKVNASFPDLPPGLPTGSADKSKT